jgi:hypothetical protein
MIIRGMPRRNNPWRAWIVGKELLGSLSRFRHVRNVVDFLLILLAARHLPSHANARVFLVHRFAFIVILMPLDTTDKVYLYRRDALFTRFCGVSKSS